MKILLCSFIITGLIANALQARTWTSSDGSRTFEGTLRSYNSSTGEVTVLINGRAVDFPESKLSEADIAFLKEQDQEKANSSTMEEESVVEAVVKKAKLHRLDGKRFRRAELEKTPEYYIFYFSASWCPPCRAAAPGMVEKYQSAIPDNAKVAMIHVSLDQTDDAAESWATAEGFPWLTVLPDDLDRSKLIQYKTTSAVPECIVYRANGEEVSKGSGSAFRLAENEKSSSSP